VNDLLTGTAGSALLILALMAGAHFMLRWYTRRRCHRLETKAAADDTPRAQSTRHWAVASILSMVAPVALLLWIHALRFAIGLLLARAEQPWVAQYALPALEFLYGLATMGALIWLLLRVGRAIESWLATFARPSHSRSDGLFLPIIGAAVRLLLPLLAITLGSSLLAVPERLQAVFRNAVSMVLVGAVAYVLYRLVDATCDLILERYRIDVADNRQARAVHTQVTVLRKVAVTTIGLFAFAGMLMVFDQVRQIGATILASAGLAGIVLGFAAQRSLGMLLAGFQIALTQPIRMDDVVIVEGEWGKIEEITLTYVVVNIWDQRRLIVPMTYFLEKSFQNWTRTSVEMLGTVELYVDYSVPMEQLRERLTTILNASQLWDRRVNVLQVTDTREHTVQIRALISAANAGAAFDLRCEVREALVRYLQQEHPESLPRFRLARSPVSNDAVANDSTPVSPGLEAHAELVPQKQAAERPTIQTPS
jgi:small-conductance mechanosensitive channel